ncbi:MULTISPECIES: L,D-transpeptidase family protein [unclassified Devosia]|uniref:L,D-transpeptidase family protein n=1 Tax=unclassified Devosia TaxID=196773 RepID=UPI0015546936|nr:MULTISPECIES: L,D-transpeptidase family protein [unclassified Devosia]
MHKILVCFLAVAAANAPLPILAQDVASITPTRIVIAPAQSALARTIKASLSAAYTANGRGTAAYAEAQKLYFLYGERYFEPIWLSEQANGQVVFSPAAQQILDLFARAESEGLNPADYLTPDLQLPATGGDPVAMAALETAFSAATLRYATHIYTGRVAPRSVDANLDVEPKTLDAGALLVELAASKDPAKVLAKLEPTHPEFLALKAALAKFNDNATNRPAPIPTGVVLKAGMTDERLPLIRQRLGLVADASLVYDQGVVQAVKDFQQGLGLEPDGVAGPATVAALNGGNAATREQIIANMERWRWMPRELGNFHVLVNIPEFRLSINRNGAETYTTRVVVGTVKNQTPVFSDNIRHIVVNPYWNVPSSIVKGEIAPKTWRNPGYIDAQNMDLIYNGDVVSPWQVNWSAVGNTFPFKVRQRPGPSNALGQIKFLFPNKHDVYLHDTPSKALFSRSQRALSHGCVRVQNPMEFADALMANETKISRASLEAMFGSSERWVNPEQQIPVHLSYFTLRPQADGNLQSYGDIYGHDTKLIQALGLSPAALPQPVMAETIADVGP